MPVVVQRQLLMVQMTSRLSPYSALSLVRQRIHAVRQSTRLSGRISHYFSWFPGDDFMFVSVFSAEFGSSADTCTASVYYGLGFSLKVDSDPEVASASSSWTS